MKRKILIIPNNVLMYARVGSKKQINDNLLILKKDEALEIYQDLKKIFSKEVPLISFERDDIWWHFLNTKITQLK